MEIKLKDLLEAGCHFGHQTSRWNPKMKPYIFTARDKIHIFDLVKTKEGLEVAYDFIKKLVADGGKIVFVGTKRQAKEIVKETAIKVGMPYSSEHWIGGTITNWDQIKKNIDKLADLKKKKESGELKEFTKKENLLIDREIAKLENHFGGISTLEHIPEALFVVDVKKELGAVKEAKARGIKVIGLVDTNSNPDLVDFVIPANDDAVKSVQLILNVIEEAVEAGKKEMKNEKGKMKKERGEEVGEAKETKETKETGKTKVPKAAKISKVSKEEKRAKTKEEKKEKPKKKPVKSKNN